MAFAKSVIEEQELRLTIAMKQVAYAAFSALHAIGRLVNWATTKKESFVYWSI